MSSLDDYWPAAGRGSVVITTRNQNLIQPPVSASIQLRCFSNTESTQFILNNIPAESRDDSKVDDKNAAKISATCGGLPLALTQVIRFIRSLNVPLAEARRRFPTPEEFVRPNSELNQFHQPDYYHQVGVPLLWDNALQDLDSACSSLIQFLAHLDPDSIPEDLIKSLFKIAEQSRLGIGAE